MKKTILSIAICSILFSCNEVSKDTHVNPDSIQTQNDYKPKYYITGYIAPHKNDNGFAYGAIGTIDRFATKEYIIKEGNIKDKSNIDDVVIISMSEVTKEMYESAFEEIKKCCYTFTKYKSKKFKHEI